MGSPKWCADIGPHFSFELQQQSLCGLLADAWHLDQIAWLLQRDGLRQIRHTHARQHRQRGARPDTRNFDELPKGFTLGGVAKAVKNLRIFADHKMRE